MSTCMIFVCSPETKHNALLDSTIKSLVVQRFCLQPTETLGPLLISDGHDPEHDNIIEVRENLRCAQNTPGHQQEIHFLTG